MATMTRRLVARVRGIRWKLGRTAFELRSPRRTALRVAADRLPPHPEQFARFGTGSVVVAPARIVGAAGIEIGDDVIVDELSTIDVAATTGGRLVIGDGCRFGPAFVVACESGVTIGDRVTAGSRVAITDRLYPNQLAPVTIEDGVHLGCGAIVGAGVHIGRDAVVADGAVVVDDVAPGAFVVGNPAVATAR